MTDLKATNTLTTLLCSKGITTWENLLHYIKNLPYGRNQNRTDFSLVITENKGTCSSKHALVASVAFENDIRNVELIIGMYKMKESNTAIGTLLSEKNIDFIPEAHCYLKINGKRIDLTTETSNFSKIEKDLLEEIVIEPNQVGDYKIEYHKDYLKKWLYETHQKHNFDEIWSIREKCIQKLSENKIGTSRPELLGTDETIR